MKKIITLFLTAFIAFTAYAGNISSQEAKKVAKNFLSETYVSQNINLQLSDLVLEATETDEAGEPVFYRFSINGNGFVLVSATDLVTPVLAYSFESAYKSNPMSDRFLEKYKRQISDVKAGRVSKLSAATTAWEHFSAENFVPVRTRDNDFVDPLITTTWTQETYYNTYCPYDKTIEINDQRAVVGCVALTMANILNYYRYPERGISGLSYLPASFDENGAYAYPRQEVRFYEHTYNYDAMTSIAEKYTNELAKLIYHCGVSAHMAYGYGYVGPNAPDGSSSNTANALTGFKANWGYSETVTALDAQSIIGGNNANYYRWGDTLKAELRKLRPIYFSANTGEEGSGHAFLLDGFDANGLFHINWGWEGLGNAFYQINWLVDPQGTGMTSYNNDENVLYNLFPANQEPKPTEGTIRNTATRGVICDGAGNLNYENNTEREWIIAPQNAKSFQFTFAKLKTEADNDVIKFYNAATDELLGTYSGHYLNIASGDVYKNYNGTIDRPEGVFPEAQKLPADLFVTADSVKVTFTTNEDITDNGFVIYYEATLGTAPSCAPNPNNFINAGEGTLKDKDAEGNYQGDVLCQWRIKPSASLGLTKLTFDFNKFDLKAGDFVEIFNYTGGIPQLFARYDIYNMPNGPFVCDFTDISVKFVSDNWATGEGFELQFGGTTEVNETSDIQNVNIFPNPATNNLNVALTTENEGNVSFKMVDMTGKVVYAENVHHNGGEANYQFSVNQLAKGFYFMNIETENGKTIRKFIVE